MPCYFEPFINGFLVFNPLSFLLKRARTWYLCLFQRIFGPTTGAGTLSIAIFLTSKDVMSINETVLVTSWELYTKILKDFQPVFDSHH